jgi:hypothetical protein
MTSPNVLDNQVLFAGGGIQARVKTHEVIRGTRARTNHGVVRDKCTVRGSAVRNAECSAALEVEASSAGYGRVAPGRGQLASPRPFQRHLYDPYAWVIDRDAVTERLRAANTG